MNGGIHSGRADAISAEGLRRFVAVVATAMLLWTILIWAGLQFI